MKYIFILLFEQGWGQISLCIQVVQAIHVYTCLLDLTKQTLSFQNVPALNGTHFLMVTTQPVVVTDTIRIVPSTWEKRACFKLAIQGCDPNSK